MRKTNTSRMTMPGVVGGGFVAAFGVLWTILAFVITADSPIPVVGIIFPLFGICFVAFAIFGIVLNLRLPKATAEKLPEESAVESPPLPAVTGTCQYCNSGLHSGDRTCGQCGAPARVQ